MLLTVKQLHEYLGLSLDRCYELVHSQSFPSIKIGGRYYIERDQVDEWLRRQRNKEIRFA